MSQCKIQIHMYSSYCPACIFDVILFQPEVHPGQCWAFRGTQGFIVIQTSRRISATGFTLEHIPKLLAPSGEIDSAPKDFTVIVSIEKHVDFPISMYL